WRDPSRGLLGVYGAHTRWDKFDGIHVNHVGPEFEWYSGRWTVQGVIGAEFGSGSSATVGTTILTYDITTRLFHQINVASYPIADLKVFAGHRYLGGKNALALGGEYGVPMSRSVMAAVFAEGRVGEGDFRGVWGGLRLYFGQRDKSLIRRHREDDPT